MTTTRSKALPLDGVTVVSLEQAIAAPFCTRQLADMGARIIKVERPEVGDFARAYDSRVNGMSSHFVWTNRSKESLALDLKTPRDINALKKVLLRADVMVQNLAPGAAERLGLSYEELQKANPGIIVCDISGYGSHGPYRDKKAYDLLVQSEAGILAVTGGETEPAKTGVSIADIAAGMYAYSNILVALLERGKTNRGRRIDISMLESMVEWMSFPMYYAFDGQPGPARTGASHATIYPYGRFETGADGASVMMGVQNEREWTILCREVLRDDNLATDERFTNNSLRSQNRAELKKIICARFSSLTAGEVVKRLDRAGIANANINDMQGVWNHPQLRARDRWIEVKTPNGTVPGLLPPGLDNVSQVGIGEVPSVGQHNEAILSEFGLLEEE
ncbi:transferase family III [Trichoderma arundinaceum]|uniref:Transferase family III n=1 Tax=Trichoderma arundinaceum TaxID=490622 RepID=A0A395NWE9_TRIAR|nr:transferase family III [Trichoderma arundinaceum]